MDPSWELQAREKRSIEPSKNYETLYGPTEQRGGNDGTERRKLRSLASLWVVSGLVVVSPVSPGTG